MATIDFLFLANHVETQNGLLYASGVGWYHLYRPQPTSEDKAPITHFGVGTSVLIPWEEANTPHHLTVRIEQAETAAELVRVETDIEVGLPPGLPSGTEQRPVFGLPANIAFPVEGVYRVVAQVDEDERSISFMVHDSPQIPQF